MKVVSIFSGAGGMDYGFRQAGFEIVFANDIYKYACETYEKNFGLKPVRGDISKIKKFPKADVLLACNPCQGFSIIGKRDENDERNMLYKEIFRCLDIIRPKYFVVENVKGLKWLYRGKFYNKMISGFEKRGYNVTPTLVNAKDYGVPQNRERIIMVGVRKSLRVKYSFPLPTHGDAPGLLPYLTMAHAIGGLPTPTSEDCYLKDNWPFFYMSRNRRADWNEVSYTIQTEPVHVPLHPSSPRMVKAGKDKFIFTDSKEKYRRLSATECALIQSFPNSFSFVGPLVSRYRLIGNAVPPRLAYVIAESIKSTETARICRFAKKGISQAKVRQLVAPLVSSQ